MFGNLIEKKKNIDRGDIGRLLICRNNCENLMKMFQLSIVGVAVRASTEHYIFFVGVLYSL
jgi:hypothetical protein